MAELSLLVKDCTEVESGREGSSEYEALRNNEHCALIERIVDKCFTECNRQNGVNDLMVKMQDLERQHEEITNRFELNSYLFEEYRKMKTEAMDVAFSSDSSDECEVLYSSTARPNKHPRPATEQPQTSVDDFLPQQFANKNPRPTAQQQFTPPATTTAQQFANQPQRSTAQQPQTSVGTNTTQQFAKQHPIPTAQQQFTPPATTTAQQFANQPQRSTAQQPQTSVGTNATQQFAKQDPIPTTEQPQTSVDTTTAQQFANQPQRSTTQQQHTSVGINTTQQFANQVQGPTTKQPHPSVGIAPQNLVRNLAAMAHLASSIAQKRPLTPAKANQHPTMPDPLTPADIMSQNNPCAAFRDAPAYQPTNPPTTPLVVGMKVFARKHTEFWCKAVIVEVINEDKPDCRYKVKFDVKGLKQVTRNHVAMTTIPMVKLAVGTRIIAVDKSDNHGVRAYHAGIIAEPPSIKNNGRYLVFFDTGYAQYCNHKEVHQVFWQNKNVWEDIHPEAQEFTKRYLREYPDRPMVRLSRGQIVKTEWKGTWWTAKVSEVDASLVKIYFEADKRVEWIYRGSTRLEVLYKELANQEAKKMAGRSSQIGGRMGSYNIPRKKRPMVVYDREQTVQEPPKERRQVAKKSTATRQIKDKSPENKTPQSTDEDNMQGTRKELNGTRRRNGLQALFRPHRCCNGCVAGTDNPREFLGSNPLLIPKRCGWRRCRSHCEKSEKIQYLAPCGRNLRNMDELDRYLQMTESNMTTDLFCFDAKLHTDEEYAPPKTFIHIKDLSYGKETVPVSCVNSIDQQYPDYVEYAIQRIPTEGVKLNLDPNFLVGCDCTDGCRDRAKCKCQQMTIEMTKVLDYNNNAGYKHRRLTEPVVTGIYECNSRCKCDSRCGNRVVQNGLSLRLQVFKTEKSGWGLLCLDDIPNGGFICIYAGHLLNDKNANDTGNQYGDEYLASLDYIETVERGKEGYESDVEMPSDEDKKKDSAPRNCVIGRAKKRCGAKVIKKAKKRPRDYKLTSNDDKASDQSAESTTGDLSLKGLKITDLSSLNVDNELDDSDENNNNQKDNTAGYNRMTRASAKLLYSSLPDPKSKHAALKISQQEEKKNKFQHTRKYFKDPDIYVMDAKSTGNLGRYLNHSCDPNVIVQNVFVDTHDLRFPWVCFFARQFIAAGSELTWDYNYEVGSVPGKVLHCYCGSSECKGRLL